MPETQAWGVDEAFAYYGAKCRNPLWSWSARNEEGKTVVVALWEDRFVYDPPPARYDAFGGSVDKWVDRLGKAELVENLIWARDHCGGHFRAVIVLAAEAKAGPRTAIQRYPQPNMLLRLIDLDETTGEFRALVEDVEAPT